MTPSPNHSDQPESSRSIWVFTPSRTPPEDLEAIFVQRHELLKDAVERVRESALTDHKHHLLFVGPRGCGKTHLVTLIVNRISADAEAAAALRLAWLNEDETCTTLLELLLKIHAALEKRYPAEFRADDLAGAYELKATAAQDFVAQRLLEGLGSKTLVIVTENLDALFDSMGQEGQKQLRAFVQEHPRIPIVATAQRLVEDLSDRASPFFGFFQTEHLKTLTVEQATDLLQNIARIQGKDEVIAFLETSRGRSRVRALHHLSGGNHRIYIVLSQFITRESMDALVGPFLKMVDELTPYYQERVRWLPPLQRKIVELLCTCEGTVPVKKIARRLFSTPQTISSQLQDLREKGYVESSQRGRESLYEISEPLMRICVEVKENQNNQPLRLLVDFLRVWYDDGELKRRLGLALPESINYPDLENALERNEREGSLRIKLLWEEAGKDSCLGLAAVEVEKAPPDVQEALLHASCCWKEGDVAGAHETLRDASDQGRSPDARSLLFLASSFMYWKNGEWTSLISELSHIIDLPDAPPELMARALFSRGVTHGQQGDPVAEIADYTRVIELPNAPPKQVAMALFNRGLTHAQQGDSTAAIADFSNVVKLPDAGPEDVIDAYQTLALLHFADGRWNEGFAALESGVSLGAQQSPPRLEAPVDIIGVFFAAGLSPEGRRVQAGALYSLYAKHAGEAVLGEALVKHLGAVFRTGAPWPSADNLDQWLVAWQMAAGDAPEFKLPLRLLRTGIEFVKSGGKEEGILLDLTSPERSILRQALGLSS
jgi:DNA-binding transcriptional ArsR family regulator